MNINNFLKRRNALNNAGGFNYLPFIISHWAFDGNANDSVGVNNGTATSVTYPTVSGIQMADFSASTAAKISVPDDDSLSFGNNLTDNDFSLDFLIYFDSINLDQRLFSKGSIVSQSVSQEYVFHFYDGKLRPVLVDQGGSLGYRYKESPFSASTGVIYHFGFTYTSGILKTYADGVEISSTQLDAGTYIAMSNETSPVTIGKYPNGSAFSLNGKLGVLTLWNKGLSDDEVLDIATKKLAGIAII